MPRPVPHFKSYLSLEDHGKLIANDHLFATYHRLGHMAVRRMAAKNGGLVRLSDRDRRTVTARARIDIAEKSLRLLAEVGVISLGSLGEVWEIFFPNFAESQGFAPNKGTEKVPERGPSQTPSLPVNPEVKDRLSRGVQGGAAVAAYAAPDTPAQLQLVSDRKPAVKRGRPARVPTQAPDALTDMQRIMLVTWCREKQPAAVPHLDALIEECFDYFRGRGKPMVDWLATIRHWIPGNVWKHVRNAEPRPPIGGGRYNRGSIAALWEVEHVD